MTRLLAVDGSPRGGGRTRTALAAVLAEASRIGVDCHLAELATDGVDRVVASAGTFDTFVFGAPVYRAAPASLLKEFLDALPRGFWGETEQPITARAVGIVLTGASWHHYLAMDGLRSILAGFFAAHVLSPGLYLPPEGFADGELSGPYADAAAAQARALVALSRAIEGAPDLQAVRPQA